MPSFLNKVFGYKKHEDKEAARPTREASDSTLLDGKYEAILPIVSPSASTFPEAHQTKEPDRDTGFSLFKPKTRGLSQKSAQKRSDSDNVPHLKLQLPGPKGNLDSRALGVVFEAVPDSQIVLDDAVIAAKRLNPLEALILVKACTQAIAEHGLETLGVMHPHWFSASPDAQRRLISQFIRSLTQSRITTLSPTSTSPTSAFENELHHTRSPHDVAAVLRWGIRHLSLENGHFGKDSTEWGWYNTFFQAECNASYPATGFSELLLPQLPAPHVELLTATLSLISSLASHAEANSISGSKLSKFLGLWLLVATRTEQSDDWSRFYARWERSGRILEHLFLARLREDSVGQRLPTRLQELVNYYPYNKGSPAIDDGLLPRPRFSTRQHDALFVRVETLLGQCTEQPRQHPIQLLLEAFQLPIDNPPGDEHMALWNALKTTAFEKATSSDPEGPQFTRIFVDETIHLLSLIPADSSHPASPTFLTSPITGVVSRKRSSSLARASEHTVSISNVNDISTPASPTSPSSVVVTDWAQFALSGFGDTPTTQPLAALLSQDDDVEVTQPWASRKSSRQRGKSRSRRRRSEDREPLNTPLSSQPDSEPIIVETKLASVHVVQIDEAFIDFWSDAIVDPISANWPTFVVCGLKQTPTAEQHIHWLVIEQAYSHQELQSSRVPSPDGRRGRSPRPSFKSDISGFRINSMFSSARKRFSLFSKSATDLDLKKPGVKTPVAGELGEVLVEEEPTFPSALSTKAGLHDDGNAAVRAAGSSGAPADVADQLKAGEISAVPIAGIPPVSPIKGESGSVQVAAEGPSIEPLAQSGVGNNAPSVLPRSSVRASEETISVERDLPRTLAVVNPEVDSSANPAIASLAADTPSLQSIQGTCDPTVLPSGPTSCVENHVAEEVHTQIDHVQQAVAAKAEDELVALVAQTEGRDVCFHTESTATPSNVVQVDAADNSLREDTETVAMSSASETVVLMAATPVAQLAVVAAVDDKISESTVEEPHGATQLSQKASADPVAAFAVESVRERETDDRSPVLATDVVATEAVAHLEPRPVTSVVDDVEEPQEVAELAEIPTPTSEPVGLVEETPGEETSVDVCGHGGPQNHVAKPVVFDDAASQPVAAELQTTLHVEASSAPHRVEAPYDEVVLAVGTSVQVLAVETEHAADQVPELTPEEALPHVQDTIVQAAEAPSVEVSSAPQVKDDVSAGIVSASHVEDVVPTEVEAHMAPEGPIHEDSIIETQDTGMPTHVLEQAALFDETPGPAANAHEPVEVPPTITAEFEAGAKTRDPVAEAIVAATDPPIVYIPLVEEVQPSLEAEPPTRADHTQAAEALSTAISPEAATAALATVDEVIPAETETKSTPHVHSEDAEAETSVLESARAEDTSEVANEANGPAPSTITESEPVEGKAAEPFTEEARVLMRDAVPVASEPVAITSIDTVQEPVAHDVQAPIEIDRPSGELAPQSVEEVANPPVVAVPAPEEIVADEVGTQLEPEVIHPTVDEPLVEDVEPALASELGVPFEETQVIVDAGEPEISTAEPESVEVRVPTPVVEDVSALVAAEVSSPVAVEVSEHVVTGLSDAAPPIDINEAPEVREPQQVVIITEQPLTPEIDVSEHEPTEHPEEIAAAEP